MFSEFLSFFLSFFFPGRVHLRPRLRSLLLLLLFEHRQRRRHCVLTWSLNRVMTPGRGRHVNLILSFAFSFLAESDLFCGKVLPAADV